MDNRQIDKSDYDDFYLASKAQAEEQYRTAEFILESVGEYLETNVKVSKSDN